MAAAAVLASPGCGLVVAPGATAGRLAAWRCGAVVAAILVVVAVGWPVQQHFLEHRYDTTDLARSTSTGRSTTCATSGSAVLGQPEVYPMFGPDLSNDVVHLTNKDRRADLPVVPGVARGAGDRYDYVAVLPFFIIPMDMEADELARRPRRHGGRPQRPRHRVPHRRSPRDRRLRGRPGSPEAGVAVQLRHRERHHDDVHRSYDLLRWGAGTARRYMGDDQAEAYGRRNAVPPEMVVRVTVAKVVATIDVAD